MATIRDRFKAGFNAFRKADQRQSGPDFLWEATYTTRPDRLAVPYGIEQTILNSIYNQIATAVSLVDIHHCRLDKDGRFSEYISSDLEECFTGRANIDQTGRELIFDIAFSMCTEGVIALVPVEATADPEITESYDIKQLRTGRIIQWSPRYVQVSVYDDRDGERKDIWCPKNSTAILENPLYSVMNSPNSTLKRLTHKLALLDKMDDKAGADKLDLVIQLPYAVRSELRRQQADQRRKDIINQLSDSKYGVAYTDGTERIVQLNRAVENQLMPQIQYLTTTLYSQLGMSDKVFNGTANEEEMLNFDNRTVEPFLMTIVEEMRTKFLSKTARTKGQTIKFFKDPFRLVPVGNIADIADKLTRNAVLSSNEVRAIIGYKPSDDEDADELRNKNLNKQVGDIPQQKNYQEEEENTDEV